MKVKRESPQLTIYLNIQNKIMINTTNFVKYLYRKDIKFYCGVPDSCVNEFCNELNKHKKIKNIVTANEGSGVSLGIGYYLSKKKLACVYLQNSGIGNATDPLTNLSNKEVYKIPMILLIGWRGAPGIKDEAQHDVQGRILTKLLKLYQIKYTEIKNDSDLPKISKLINYSKKKSRCVALLVKPKIFSKNKKNIKGNNQKKEILRKHLITSLLKNVSKKTKIITSVGFNSRELYQIRKEKNFKNGKDFLMIGAMGHTSMVSIGISKHTNENTICVDGDGSFIMHLGALTLVGDDKRKNFKYILVDNESHESIGDQPISLKNINIKRLSQALGFKKFFYTEKINKLDFLMKKFINSPGPSFYHIKIKTGTLPNLVRPKKFEEIKKRFMN